MSSPWCFANPQTPIVFAVRPLSISKKYDAVAGPNERIASQLRVLKSFVASRTCFCGVGFGRVGTVASKTTGLTGLIFDLLDNVWSSSYEHEVLVSAYLQ